MFGVLSRSLKGNNQANVQESDRLVAGWCAVKAFFSSDV